jgi:glycosyltransferase involved in cell wall biosynthesis
LRIGLDVHVLTGPHQGTSSVWTNLLNELSDANEYVLYSFAPEKLKLDFPQKHFIHQRIPRIPAAARIQFAFPFMTRRDGCDVFHSNYYGPIVGGPPLVLHVHDLIYMDFPEYSTGMRRAMFATLGRASARAAAQVVTVSEYAKGRIVKLYGVDEDRISVVSNGLDRSWLNPSDEKIENAWQALKPRVPKRYALSVGRLDPRKNFALTARVVRRLVEQGLLDGLVIVGSEDFGGQEFRDQLEREGTARFVTRLSGLDNTSLQAVYKHASCLLYLSLAEGFGVPLIEAMALRTPIVASDRTSIPEVVGDAGISVPASDEAAITAAASSILTDPQLRQSLIARGVERLSEFRASDVAPKMERIYAKAAARSSI